MDESTGTTLVVVMNMLALLCLGLVVYAAYTQLSSLNYVVTKFVAIYENGKLYDPDNREYSKLLGVYFPEDYYCVWTEGKDADDIVMDDPYLTRIEETAIHEYCHHLVHTRTRHFCENTSWYEQ